MRGDRLFGAIRRGDIRAVRALVAKGVQQNVTDEHGRTPSEYARALAAVDLATIIETADTEPSEG